MNELIPFELTINSARLQKNAKLFTKTRAYTVVSLIGNGPFIVTGKTPVDKHGGENPFWGSTMKLSLEETKLHGDSVVLVFEVRCKQTLSPDQDLGFVYVPLRQLFRSTPPRGLNCHKNAAFLARSRSGKAKCVLYVSYRFGVGPTAENTTGFMVEGAIFPTKPVPSAPYLEEDS